MLQTYYDLQTAIIAWLSRSGDAKVTPNTADLISLCEDMIAYGNDDPQFPAEPLRIRAMETSTMVVISSPVQGNTVSGTANAITITPQAAVNSYSNGLLYQFTALSNNTGAVQISLSGLSPASLVKGASRTALSGNEIIAGGTYNVYYDDLNSVWVLLPELAHLPLPANYLALRSWYYLWQTNFPRSLSYKTPQQINDMGLITVTDAPKVYTMEADAIRFAPPPDSTYFAPMLYYRKFDALASAAGNTNWLLQNAPRVYLFGALMWASLLLKDDAGASRYYRFYVGACNSIQDQDDLDRHSGSALTITNLTGNP